MDIKIAGLTREIIEKAINQAKEGRMHILSEMSKSVSTHRPELKPGAPVMMSFKIKPDEIGGLIGPGGKNIKAIQEDFQVKLDVKEDGTVHVLGQELEQVKACIALVTLQMKGPEVGTDYEAKVVSIKEYGAFVDIAPGVSGLVHISEFSDDRVKDVREYATEGDLIKVRVIEVDRMGRLKLSAKAVAAIPRKDGKTGPTT